MGRVGRLRVFYSIDTRTDRQAITLCKPFSYTSFIEYFYSLVYQNSLSHLLSRLPNSHSCRPQTHSPFPRQNSSPTLPPLATASPSLTVAAPPQPSLLPPLIAPSTHLLRNNTICRPQICHHAARFVLLDMSPRFLVVADLPGSPACCLTLRFFVLLFNSQIYH